MIANLFYFSINTNMQISFKSQNIFNFPQHNFTNPVNTVSKNVDRSQISALANYEQCAGFLYNIKPVFNHENTKINNIRKLFKDENGKFSIQKAAQYIKQLTDEQLLLYSSQDINAVITEVINANPKLSRAEVLKTLAQLTSFSSYDSLDSIEEYCAKENITQIYSTEKLTINNILLYFSNENKSLLKLADKNTDGKKGFFIDRNSLEELKELKDKKPDDFVKLKEDIIQGKIKFILLDGWEAKTNMGYKSFNFVGAWGDLAEATSAVIQKQSEQKSSVFNQDIIENINTLFEDDMPVDIIQNMPDEIDENVIAKRLNPKTLNEDDIITAINKTSLFSYGANVLSIKLEELRDIEAKLKKEPVNMDDKDLKEILKAKELTADEKISIQELLSLMFIYTCNAYSPRKIALEMKDMHKKLSDRCFYYDKPESNMLFIIPQKDKSFGLVNYQYSKVNNIPLDNYIYTNKTDITINEQKGKNKIAVLLDDFAGSGRSMFEGLLPYISFRFTNKQHIIFAALSYLPKAKQRIEEGIDSIQREHFIKDSFIGGKEIKTLDNLARLLPHHETQLITQCINSGYSKGGSSIAFPHVIPDNCIDVSGLILENLLRNKKANKAKLQKYKEELLIRKIAQQN